MRAARRPDLPAVNRDFLRLPRLRPGAHRFAGVAEVIHALQCNPVVSAALVAVTFVSNLAILFVEEAVRGAFALFLFVPIMLAGLSFGLYGGLLAGILGSVFIAFVPPWYAAGVQNDLALIRVDWGVRAVWFCCVGALVGILAESSRFMLSRVNHLRGVDPATGRPDFDAAGKHIEVLLRSSPGEGEDPGVHVTQIRVHNFDPLKTRFGARRMEEIMQQLRERIRAVLPARAFVSRSDIDTFAVVESGDPTWSEREQLRRLQEVRNEPFEVDGMVVYTELVAGAASGVRGRDEAGDLLSRARRNAGHATPTGGADYGRPLPVRDRSAADLTLLGDVGRAIEQGEIRVVYQPVLNLHSRKFVKLEALARWNHPTRGLIPPSKFIPLIDHSDMFHVFTRWIFDEVIEHLAGWAADGVEPTVFVNLTPTNLMDRTLLVELPRLLQSKGLPLSALGLEISERFIMSLKGRQLEYLRQLKSMGMHCMADKFVGNKVPLTHLRTLPVDGIKLDAEQLCTDAGRLKDPDTTGIIVNMAHDLGLSVTGTGVASQTHFGEFKAAGCDELQGFFLARPLEADKVEGVITRRFPQQADYAGQGEGQA